VLHPARLNSPATRVASTRSRVRADTVVEPALPASPRCRQRGEDFGPGEQLSRRGSWYVDDRTATGSTRARWCIVCRAHRLAGSVGSEYGVPANALTIVDLPDPTPQQAEGTSSTCHRAQLLEATPVAALTRNTSTPATSPTSTRIPMALGPLCQCHHQCAPDSTLKRRSAPETEVRLWINRYAGPQCPHWPPESGRALRRRRRPG
jgi:hypothetical protein